MRAEDVISELAPRRGFLKLAGGLVGAAAGVQMLGFEKLFAATVPQGTDSVQDIINAARTAEELAVTFQYNALTSPVIRPLLDAAGQTKQIQVILDAEADHLAALTGQGAQTLNPSGNYYFPKGTYDNLLNYANTAIIFETVFVGAYLAAIAELVQRGTGYIDLAVIAGQFMGVEAEHRVLSRQLAGLSPASDLSWERYIFSSVGNTRNLDPNSAVAAVINFNLLSGGATSTGAYALPSSSSVETAIGGQEATVPAAAAGQTDANGTSIAAGSAAAGTVRSTTPF